MTEFMNWLSAEKGFSPRTTRDVCSRLKRAQQFVNAKAPEDIVNSELEKNAEFNSLSFSVKSQLRRSIKLYAEYREIK